MFQFSALYLLALFAVSILLGIGIKMRINRQYRRDAARKYYEIMFPNQLDEKQTHAFIRSIGKSLNRGSVMNGVPTIVFETWASAKDGISHRLRLPEVDATYLIGQLQTHIPGVDVRPLEDDDEPNLPDDQFDFGATVHMHNPSEELVIASSVDFAAGLLGSMQDAMQEGDKLVVQWVIAHTDNQKMPPSDKPVRSNRSALTHLIMGVPMAGHDEVNSRRVKQQDQNYLAVGRIAASGRTLNRSEHLVRQVAQKLGSEGGTAILYPKRANAHDLSREIAVAYTPLHLTAQFSVTELSAVIGWPFGDYYIPGLKRGSTRHMPPTEDVPRISHRQLGKSTMPGAERAISMSHESSTRHMLLVGSSGSGKTNELVNILHQDIKAGCGIILLERDGNLYQQALDQVPAERMHDVICIDLTRSDRPVGLNLLRLGKPSVIAGQLASLLDGLYPDMKSVYANQLVMNGVPVLAGLERATIADLLVLAHPRTPQEIEWAKSAVARMRDKQIRAYWDDWYQDLKTKDQRKITQNSQALKNRLWELLIPEPTRYLLDQETSSFDPNDVINGNKLLFVNLAGVSEQAASLIGNMIVAACWRAAQQSKPVIPNFMYLDEFQQFSHLSSEFEDMFATARKRNLGLVVATQYIERLPRTIQDAVLSNTGTKIAFNSSSASATTLARDFASRHVNPESFQNLKFGNALVRVMTRAGVSTPITMKTTKAPRGPQLGNHIQRMSDASYGRDISKIEADESSRRVKQGNADARPLPRIGWE